MREFTHEEKLDIAEMLFYFHFDQMAANLQVVASRVLKHEEKYEFKSMLKKVNSHWKKFENRWSTAGKHDDFENLAILLGDTMRLFLESPDPYGLLQMAKDFNERIPAEELLPV